MPDVILSDGREITLDLCKMSVSEWRAMLRPTATEDAMRADDAVIARVAGLTLEEYDALPQPDWRLMVRRLIEKAREPLADPN